MTAREAKRLVCAILEAECNAMLDGGTWPYLAAVKTPEDENRVLAAVEELRLEMERRGRDADLSPVPYEGGGA